jgi:hypothetical protein
VIRCRQVADEQEQEAHEGGAGDGGAGVRAGHGFSSKPFVGSLGASPPPVPIVAVAAMPS